MVVSSEHVKELVACNLGVKSLTYVLMFLLETKICVCQQEVVGNSLCELKG